MHPPTRHRRGAVRLTMGRIALGLLVWALHGCSDDEPCMGVRVDARDECLADSGCRELEDGAFCTGEGLLGQCPSGSTLVIGECGPPFVCRMFSESLVCGRDPITFEDCDAAGGVVASTERSCGEAGSLAIWAETETGVCCLQP